MVERKTLENWNKLKRELKIGQKISGKIFKVEHYGVYVDIGKDFYGIVLAPYISNKRITMDDYPSVGEVISGVIIDFSDNNIEQIEFNYVVISIKDFENSSHGARMSDC